MNFSTFPYGGKYRAQCISLMNDTWNFNSLFPKLKRQNLINEVFFDGARVAADYSQVLVDEKGQVGGYLFGVLNRGLSYRVRSIVGQIFLVLKVLVLFLSGAFGPRREAWKRAREVFSMEETLESEKRKSDGYVSLFFVSSALRGHGWGKRLMDEFYHQCREKGFQRIYLWTDKGCNYHFYERQGFQRIRSISSPLLSFYGNGPNGFVYTKAVG